MIDRDAGAGGSRWTGWLDDLGRDLRTPSEVCGAVPASRLP